MPRRVKPRKVAKLQRRYLRQQGATPQEIRRYLPILTAQIGAESNFTQGVGSPAGAQDIAQFMPGTAPGYGVRLGDNRIKDDIRGQVRYMLPLLRKYGVEGALRGYNAGVGAIEASKGYSETNNYVDRVKSTASQYRGLVSGGGGGGGGTGPQFGMLPGEDNSQLRQQLLVNYLAERGQPGALVNLGRGLQEAQDTPSRRVQTQGSRPGTPGAGGALPNTSRSLDEMFSIAERIDKLNNKGKVPYAWGGGHGGSPAKVGTPVDCSGFVSQILGITPRVSGQFASSWGKPGPGKWVTVYADQGHVLISMRDPKTRRVRWFGTSRSNPGGGAGEIAPPSKEYLARFERRHPGKR